MGLEEEIKRIHANLVIAINNETDYDSADFENFNTGLGLHLQKGILARNPKITQKLEALTTKGKLGPGNYEILKSVAKDSGNETIVNLIKRAETDIEDLKGQQKISKAGTSNSSDGRKRKRVADDDDESDPLFKRDRRNRGYYDTSKKKGYLLILNSKENREGTEKDVENLKGFFGKTLGFDIDDPRANKNDDMTTKEIKNCLESARNSLNNALSSKYYCFICVILSHGDQNGIQTKDGKFNTGEIRTFFNNTNMPRFAGRPKLFFIQACRGLDKQDGVDVRDEPDNKSEPMEVDEADVTYKIPIDADTLLAYATTPGYTSYAETNIIRGTFFIRDVCEVFMSNHSEDHVEEMLICVREKTAETDIPVPDENKKVLYVKQMPCTWSTLTKRLMLTRYTPGAL